MATGIVNNKKPKLGTNKYPGPQAKPVPTPTNNRQRPKYPGPMDPNQKPGGAPGSYDLPASSITNSPQSQQVAPQRRQSSYDPEAARINRENMRQQAPPQSGGPGGGLPGDGGRWGRGEQMLNKPQPSGFPAQVGVGGTTDGWNRGPGGFFPNKDGNWGGGGRGIGQGQNPNMDPNIAMKMQFDKWKQGQGAGGGRIDPSQGPQQPQVTPWQGNSGFGGGGKKNAAIMQQRLQSGEITQDQFNIWQKRMQGGGMQGQPQDNGQNQANIDQAQGMARDAMSNVGGQTQGNQQGAIDNAMGDINGQGQFGNLSEQQMQQQFQGGQQGNQQDQQNPGQWDQIINGQQGAMQEYLRRIQNQGPNNNPYYGGFNQNQRFQQ